ncbi:MAG: diguanylate cyclase [Gammaproteobacteria bacterium]|nr:diguanylate cyclase [Gammaproteobacteria bacterium]
MNAAFIEQLTSSELDQYANELEQAIEMHALWLTRVNKSLIFGCAPHPHDVSDKPHLLCHFGRWYHGMDDTALLDIPQFAAIGAVHGRLHDVARRLLLQRQQAQALQEDYEHFIQIGVQLRELLKAVRQSIKQNSGIASRLMAKVFENAKEGVVITTPGGVILNVNPAFSEVTGYAADEAIGNTPHLLYSGRQSGDFYAAMWRALQQLGHWQGEIWNRRKNGDIYLEWLSISSVRNERNELTHYVGIFSDITTEKENEERLYHLAHYDPLTELPNRVLFQDRFKQALARARRNRRSLAVMFLDLDGFKDVNDRYGHGAGDDLLGQVAQRLTAQLRQSDTVARLGGDEFAIILPDLGESSDVSAVARKVIDELARPFTFAGEQEVRITTSIGISLYPQHGLDSDNLLHRADTAMYVAKQRGKNQLCFYSPELE